MKWFKSSYSSDTACCVEVGFRPASQCDSSCCVEVDVQEHAVSVRDSKVVDAEGKNTSLVPEYTPEKWAALIERIKSGDETVADLDARFFPLDFTDDELVAFVNGVKAGEFDHG